MTSLEINKKIANGEISINNTERFFSIVIKGLLYHLQKDLVISGKQIRHIILNTGDDALYLEVKGQDHSLEPLEITNENSIYNSIPRCMVVPGGVEILTDQLTNPHTRGNFEFEYDDSLYSGNAEFRRMPVKISVSLKYYVSSYTDLLNLSQQITTKWMFIRNFNVDYMGNMVSCTYNIPPSLQGEYNMEFDEATTDNRYRTLSLDLEVETNLPVYNEKTAVMSDQMIGDFIVGGFIESNGTPNNGEIEKDESFGTV